MMVDLTVLDAKILQVIRTIAGAADRHGMVAYLVGGVVRDVMLGRRTYDVDIVIEGDAIDFSRRLADQRQWTCTGYGRFGTATLILGNGFSVDVASARKERYPSPGALPVVAPGTITDDLFRRDFTINAMAVVINKRDWGKLLDPFSGAVDLKKGKIRIMHPQSFVDDPTRILRAVRFEQRFGFRMESQTLGLLKASVKRGDDQYVKPARYYQEFRKILREEEPLQPIVRLSRLGGMGFLKKGFRASKEALTIIKKQAILQPHEDVVLSEEDKSLILLMALVRGLSQEEVEVMSRRFHWSKQEREAVIGSLRAKDILKQLRKKGLRRSQVYQILQPIDGQVVTYLRVSDRHPQAQHYIKEYLRACQSVKLTVTGEDLKTLAIPPGRRRGMILKELLYRKLDGEIATRKQELKTLKELIIRRDEEWIGQHVSTN
jgi:tRNA nucleotidyltransferase (CCA-adding enzyme)